jgi:hypothetical protein
MPVRAILKNCLNCNKQFKMKRPWQKFCSKSCLNRYHNRTQRKDQKLRIKRSERRKAKDLEFAKLVENKKAILR